jgi:hypothetical protein
MPDRDKFQIDPTRVEERDDITAVYTFLPKPPWLRDTDGRVVGLKASAYFLSGKTQRGAFVPGTILVWLYEVKSGPRGRYARDYVFGWEMDRQEAMKWRVRYVRKLGYQYGLPLYWPNELDLSGKLIEVEFGYERLDGRIIVGPPRRFRVPVPGRGGPLNEPLPPTRRRPSEQALPPDQSKPPPPEQRKR